MKLSREITRFLVGILDNYIPPVIRDSLWFMYIPLRIIRGNKWKIFATFKERAPLLSENEYSEIYRQIQHLDLGRETDTNKKCIKELQKSVVGTTILDAGCGKGYLAHIFARHYTVTGVDIHCASLRSGGEGPTFVSGSLENLPFPDEAFDTVICAHTLEHVLDFYHVLSELRRVTHQRLIVIVPMQRPYRYSFDLHIRFFPTIDAFRFAVRHANPSECNNIGGDIFYMEDRIH